MRIREFFATHRTYFLFLTRYGISGVTAAVIQIVGLYIWVSILGLTAEYLWGVVIAYSVAVVVAFIMQKYWTFRDTSRELMVKQLSWYTAISLANLGLNAIILHASRLILESNGLDFFHIWYLVAQTFAVVICAVIGFLFNRYVTFRSLVQ